MSTGADLLFLGSELSHPGEVLVLQLLRGLQLTQEGQVVETLAVREPQVHRTNLGRQAAVYHHTL